MFKQIKLLSGEKVVTTLMLRADNNPDILVWRAKYYIRSGDDYKEAVVFVSVQPEKKPEEK